MTGKNMKFVKFNPSCLPIMKMRIFFVLMKNASLSIFAKFSLGVGGIKSKINIAAWLTLKFK